VLSGAYTCTGTCVPVSGPKGEIVLELHLKSDFVARRTLASQNDVREKCAGLKAGMWIDYPIRKGMSTIWVDFIMCACLYPEMLIEKYSVYA
jgi:hypothetical protein